MKYVIILLLMSNVVMILVLNKAQEKIEKEEPFRLGERAYICSGFGGLNELQTRKNR